MEKQARKFGISYGQYVLLSVHTHLPSLQSSPSELADQMNISRASVSNMNGNSEKGNFLLRQLDSNDKWSIVISLTDHFRNKCTRRSSSYANGYKRIKEAI